MRTEGERAWRVSGEVERLAFPRSGVRDFSPVASGRLLFFYGGIEVNPKVPKEKKVWSNGLSAESENKAKTERERITRNANEKTGGVWVNRRSEANDRSEGRRRAPKTGRALTRARDLSAKFHFFTLFDFSRDFSRRIALFFSGVAYFSGARFSGALSSGVKESPLSFGGLCRVFA